MKDIRSFFGAPAAGATMKKEVTKKRVIEDSADETSTGSSQKRPANSQQSKEGVLASNGAYMPKVVSAPSSAKKAKVESVAVDPTSFFGSSKIKQSEKTQVKAIKKPRKTMVIEDEDDDMDFGADDDLLMQVAESTEAILSSSTPVANKENLLVDTKPIVIEEQKSTTPVKKKTPMVILDDTPEPVKKVKTPKKPTPKKEVTPKTATPKKDLLEKVEDSKAAATSSSVASPSVTEADVPKKKFNYFAHKAKLDSGPKAPGSKVIPEGADNCLLGLAFVFTGDLSSISRPEATDLVKRYGGRVVGAPSSKTSYVIVGDEPGASKLEKVKKLGLKTLDEDGFLDLIAKSKPQVDTAQKSTPAHTPVVTSGPSLAMSSVSDKMAGKAKIQSAPASVATLLSRPTPAPVFIPPPKPMNNNGQLWTDKYKPKNYVEVIGNKALMEKLAKWLREWHNNRMNDFKKRDETSPWRAALLSGPPGIGKTTMSHLVADLEGFEAIEFNASDVRSKKALDDLVKDALDTRSIGEFFKADRGVAATTSKKKKAVIIMDEVDGMSAGDRGGSAELIRLIKKSKVPIICICNDRRSPKMRSLANSCLDLSLRRPTAQQVEVRIRNIAAKEGLELKANVVAELVASTSADIRQILNLLSTYRLSSSSLSYDQSKALAKTAQKNVTVGPFDAMQRLFSQGTFRSSTFPEKIENYFHDYSLIPLMVQENYIRMSPALAKEVAKTPKSIETETMTLISNAADMISRADLLDKIQRSQNNWSLLPVHAVFSTVHPCFYTHGYMNGMYNFPSFLGQFSKQSKSVRLLSEISGHMSLHTSADKFEIRQTYIPTLTAKLMKPLVQRGQEGIEETIQLLDDYYLTKDDFDSMTEIYLGKVGDIPTAVKSAFTRTYNKGSHPTAMTTTATKGRSGGGSGTMDVGAPDCEDVIDDDVGAPEEEEEEDGNDLSGDKMIKTKTASKKSSGVAKAKAPKSAKASSSTAAKKKKK